MRRSKTLSIGELWTGFVRDNEIRSRRLNEARIPEVWAEVAGPAYSTLTTSLSVKSGTLYVTMNSSVARHEVFMRRTELRAAINSRYGFCLISNIIVK